MGYKVKKIYVGTQQVRPGEITETITVPQATSTGSGVSNFLSIYKSGYKVTKVVIEATGASNNTSNYGNVNVGIAIDNTYSISTYRWTRGTGLNNYSNIELYNPNQNILRSNLGGSSTGTNIVKLTIEEDSGSITINGTTTNWTTTSTEKSEIHEIFISSTVNALINTTRGYIGPATFTVTYTPN